MQNFIRIWLFSFEKRLNIDDIDIVDNGANQLLTPFLVPIWNSNVIRTWIYVQFLPWRHAFDIYVKKYTLSSNIL